MSRCADFEFRVAHRVRRPSRFGYARARIVGYMPPGPDAEDIALWHALHDDGDQEDIDAAELEQALQLQTELKARAHTRQARATETARLCTAQQPAAEGGAGGCAAADGSAAEGEAVDGGGGPLYEIGQEVLCEQAGALYPAKVRPTPGSTKTNQPTGPPETNHPHGRRSPSQNCGVLIHPPGPPPPWPSIGGARSWRSSRRKPTTPPGTWSGSIRSTFRGGRSGAPSGLINAHAANIDYHRT